MRFVPFLAVVLLAQDDPYRIPVNDLDKHYQKKVSAVLDDLTVAVPLERTQVKSAPEVYDFLLEELPFTAQCVRAVNKGKYEIFRGTELMKTDRMAADEKARLEKTFYLDDRDGMFVKAEMFRKEDSRFMYYMSGYDDLGPAARIWGKAVVVIHFKEDTGILFTEAKIFAKVEGVYGIAAKLIPKTTEDVARKKANLFIDAARTIAELAHADRKKFVERMQQADEVDKKTLEKFRQRFVK